MKQTFSSFSYYVFQSSGNASQNSIALFIASLATVQGLIG